MNKLFSVHGTDSPGRRKSSKHADKSDSWIPKHSRRASAITTIVFGNSARKPGSIKDEIEAGFEVEAFVRLAHELDVPQTAVIQLLNIPGATLKRRRASGRLTPEESDRVYRFSRLLELATTMMGGNEAEAKRWLNPPHLTLGARHL